MNGGFIDAQNASIHLCSNGITKGGKVYTNLFANEVHCRWIHIICTVYSGNGEFPNKCTDI